MTGSAAKDTGETRSIALLTFDHVGPNLGGAAIRVLELARALAQAGHRPTVFTPALREDTGAYPFPIRIYDPLAVKATLLSPLAEVAVMIAPTQALARLPQLSRLPIPVVFDLYDPFYFELLVSGEADSLEQRRARVQGERSVLNHALRRGDFFLCASERQRDMWLGALMANGRLSPSAGGDPGFRDLIDVVPFGISDAPPPLPPLGPGMLRTAVPTIAPGDTAIVWGGALRDWQDPLTAVRALTRLSQTRSDIHLVFFAGPHPAQIPGAGSSGGEAHALAVQCGVAGRQVHFLADWVPYAQRGLYLAEAAAGLTTHRPHLESRFSFRTRILDYLWADLPIICTEGDVLADLVVEHGLGLAVPAGDEVALAAAFERIADDPAFVAQCRAAIAGLRPSMSWAIAVAPLARFCTAPRLGDRRPGMVGRARRLAASAWRVLKSEGAISAARRLHRHVFLRA